MALHHHRVLLPVDACFQIPVHGIDEVVAVELRVKAENAAAQQAFEQFVAPGTDSHLLRVGPGNVPEDDDGCGGQPFANHRGRESEVIILHQNDRISGVHFAADRIGEFLVDGAVLSPVFGAKDRTAYARRDTAATILRSKIRSSSPCCSSSESHTRRM